MLEWPDSLPPPPPGDSPGTVTVLIGNSGAAPPTPQGLSGDAHSHRHVPQAAWGSAGLGPHPAWPQWPLSGPPLWLQRGCHRKSPSHRRTGRTLPASGKNPHFIFTWPGPGPLGRPGVGEQASCCRPWDHNAPRSVICIQQALARCTDSPGEPVSWTRCSQLVWLSLLELGLRVNIWVCG